MSYDYDYNSSSNNYTTTSPSTTLLPKTSPKIPNCPSICSCQETLQKKIILDCSGQGLTKTLKSAYDENYTDSSDVDEILETSSDSNSSFGPRLYMPLYAEFINFSHNLIFKLNSESFNSDTENLNLENNLIEGQEPETYLVPIFSNEEFLRNNP